MPDEQPEPAEVTSWDVVVTWCGAATLQRARALRALHQEHGGTRQRHDGAQSAYTFPDLENAERFHHMARRIVPSPAHVWAP